MKRKGFIGITTAIIIIAVTAIASFLFVPGVADSVFALTGSPQSCDSTPLDYRCYCGVGLQKVGIFTFRCEPSPEIPSSWSIPIDNWGEAIKFSYDKMEGIPPCEDDLYFTNEISGALSANVNEKYGGPMYDDSLNVVGYQLQVECVKQYSPSTATEVWRVQFDPNDGYIYMMECNPAYITGCPERIDFSPKYEAINPICGDGKCSPGETVDDCHDDCFIANPYCGDGICGNSQVQVNKCELADGSMKYCAITGYDTNGSPCSISSMGCVRTYGGTWWNEDENICPQDCA